MTARTLRARELVPAGRHPGGVAASYATNVNRGSKVLCSQNHVPLGACEGM